MKTKFVLIGMLVALVAFVWSVGLAENTAKAEESLASLSILVHTSEPGRFQFDTNVLDAMIYNWNIYPFPPANASYVRFGFPVDEGFVVFQGHLLATIHNICGVMPEDKCFYENQERIYDAKGTLRFVTNFPKYYTMLPYESSRLLVLTGDSVPDLRVLCTTETNTFRVCLQQTK